MNKYALSIKNKSSTKYCVTYLPLQDGLKDYIKRLNLLITGYDKTELLKKINNSGGFTILRNEKPILFWKDNAIMMVDTGSVETKDKKDATAVAVAKVLLAGQIQDFLGNESKQLITITKDEEILMDTAIC
jgi:hypothetical protein